MGARRLLQSDVLPGTSTPHAMQGDGTVFGMIESSQKKLPALPVGALANYARGRRDRVGMRGAGRLRRAVQKGYILPPGALEQIPIGASQDQVLIVMGTPSTVATLNGEVFYYISQRADRPLAS